MRRAVVMGLGVTGRAVVEALLRRDVEVVALDDRPSDELRTWTTGLGLELTPTGDDLVRVLTGADALLPAPGLPDHHPVFAAAQAVGVEVHSELDLASQWDERPVVAVTGTDGKTTVVTLIQRMLERSGITSRAVGNTETPYVDAIDDPSIEVFVVEASSFRLGHSRTFSPHVGTWLNFGPDHLDAHRSLAAYEQAKASIWQRLEPGALAIANRDDPIVMRHARGVTAELQTFGAGPPTSSSDHGIVDGALIVNGEPLIAVGRLERSLPHDLLNGLAAAASAAGVGAQRCAMADVLREFRGIEHRVELVAEIDGVRFVNDSKATTPHAAAAALGGFDSVVLLAGGRNKGLAFDDMVAHADRIKHVIALGEAAADIEAVFNGLVPVTVATSMAEAIDRAADLAVPGDVVLLSPASASYDWYRSYGARGDDFRQLVLQRSAAGDSS